MQKIPIYPHELTVETINSIICESKFDLFYEFKKANLTQKIALNSQDFKNYFLAGAVFSSAFGAGKGILYSTFAFSNKSSAFLSNVSLNF